MSEKFIKIIQGIIAFALLVIYVLVIYKLIDCLYLNPPEVECDLSNDQYKTLMWISQSIGALVSAVVISVLAISEIKGGKIKFYAGLRNIDKDNPKFVNWVTGIYIIIWLLVGAAFVFCFYKHPEVDESINNFARAFLGLAVGAGYSLFGIDPTKRSSK